MKSINPVFDDAEFEHLASIKDKTNLSWHDFIIHAATELNRNIVNIPKSKEFKI